MVHPGKQASPWSEKNGELDLYLFNFEMGCVIYSCVCQGRGLLANKGALRPSSQAAVVWAQFAHTPLLSWQGENEMLDRIFCFVFFFKEGMYKSLSCSAFCWKGRAPQWCLHVLLQIFWF